MATQRGKAAWEARGVSKGAVSTLEAILKGRSLVFSPPRYRKIESQCHKWLYGWQKGHCFHFWSRLQVQWVAWQPFLLRLTQYQQWTVLTGSSLEAWCAGRKCCWLWHFLATWPWASCPTSLVLSVPICETVVLVAIVVVAVIAAATCKDVGREKGVRYRESQVAWTPQSTRSVNLLWYVWNITEQKCWHIH